MSPLFDRGSDESDAFDEDMIDPEVVPAWREARDSLPAGWTLLGADSERFGVFKDAKFETFAAVARGPTGEVAAVMALDESTAYRELARRVRGDLEPTDVWALPL